MVVFFAPHIQKLSCGPSWDQMAQLLSCCVRLQLSSANCRRPFPFSVTRRAGNYWKLRWSPLLPSFSALSPLFIIVLLWANWTLQCHIFLLRNTAVLEAPFAFATSNQDTSSGFTEKLQPAVHLAWVKWRDKVFCIILPQVIMLNWMLFTFTRCYPIAPHTGSWWKIVYEQIRLALMT